MKALWFILGDVFSLLGFLSFLILKSSAYQTIRKSHAYFLLVSRKNSEKRNASAISKVQQN